MKPITQINVVTMKRGKIDEFIEADRRYAASTPLPRGVTGSQIYRSMDGASIVRVTRYESIEAHDQVHQDEALRRQIETLRPMVESVSAALYEEVRRPGDGE